MRKTRTNKQASDIIVRLSVLFTSAFIAGAVFAGCSDLGSNPASSDQTTSTTPLTSLQDISFRNQVQPLFAQYGCNGCHGGNGGLFVRTVAQLLQGGLHGPSIVAGNADGSNLIKKVSTNPPFGSRMPQGGPYLPDSTIQLIKLWINQGAKDN
jgi:hypothetical protein